ncbi:MAG: hypothetical protein GY827_07870 [Cytophagales bacterium]|nr:hypothetical protein [Cytophagales bacterium]
MSNKNTENWERELQDKFNNHQEPTDANDFGSFMNKLEESNFFEEEPKGASGTNTTLWTLLGAVLITGILFWLMNNNTKNKIIESNKKIVEDTNTQHISKQTNQEPTPNHEQEEAVQKVDTPTEVTNQNTKSINNKKDKQITQPVVDNKNDKVVVLPKETETAIKDSTPTEITPPQETVDTTIEVADTTPPKQEQKVVRPPKRRIVMMPVDTIVVADTSHVKHKKKDKKIK